MAPRTNLCPSTYERRVINDIERRKEIAKLVEEICPEMAKMNEILDENGIMNDQWSIKKGGDGNV